MKKSFLTKAGRLLATAALFLFSGIVVFALQTASGWTNPSSNPPGAPGALYYSSGNVGVNTSTPAYTFTVAGIISAADNLIQNVKAPENGTDAVNRDYLETYVSAQVADGGGGSVTIFSVAEGPLAASSFSAQKPARGANTPSCPAGWTTWFDGYGPHGYIGGSGWSATAGNGFGFQARNEMDADSTLGNSAEAVAATYSLCSQSDYHIIPAFIPVGPVGIVQPAYMRADACSINVVNTGNGQARFVCNTCRVCVRGTTTPVDQGGNTIPPDSRTWP